MQTQNNKVVSAVPFLLIPSDSYSSSLANIGSVSMPDVFSQNNNAEKYEFIENEIGIGVSVTKWMSQLVNDVYLVNIPAYYKLNERESLGGASFKIFKLGEIQLTNDIGTPTWKSQPNEFSLDMSYVLKLTPNYSLGVALRYIYSDLVDRRLEQYFKTGHSASLDLSMCYISDIVSFTELDMRFRTGLVLSNMGPKISYSKTGLEIGTYNNLPANFKLGFATDFILDKFNTVVAMLETNKLMVPTSPEYEKNSTGKPTEKIKKGMNPKAGIITNLYQSFYDAPDGFSEELKEYQMSFAAEWIYNKKIDLRGGYYYEYPKKGTKRFYTTGFGFKYERYSFDMSYLVYNTHIQNPLENTLFLSITIK